ncbi:hypothetical protein OUZ56_032083 [Daphnia magna]|uniref:Uncharacterized protein n=1 Tax=Daphnia magna TaxID=35525 RepID=A0ABQ9ZW35_9CRUS|nr:hypothetical protein OUZ56_032083 [Daphnia magna]
MPTVISVRRVASKMSNYYKKCIVEGCPNNRVGEKLVGVVNLLRFLPGLTNASYMTQILLRKEERFGYPGKPCYYMNKHHPDWAPSLSLNQASCSTRSERNFLFSYNRGVNSSKWWLATLPDYSNPAIRSLQEGQSTPIRQILGAGLKFILWPKQIGKVHEYFGFSTSFYA